MTKLFTVDCNLRRGFGLLLALMSLAHTGRGLSLHSPDTIYEIKNNELVPYKLTEANFEIVERQFEDGKWEYVLFIKADRPVILTGKNTLANKNPKKLENNDGLMFISQTNKHALGRTKMLNNKLQYRNLNEFITKAMPEGQFQKSLAFPTFQFEQWPAAVLISTMMNNKSVLHGLHRKLFLEDDGQPEKYVNASNIQHMKVDEIVANYSEFLLNTVNQQIRLYIMEYLKPKRDVLRAAKTCTLGHSSIESIIKYTLSVSTPLLSKIVDTSVKILFKKYYEQKFLPIFQEEGLHEFLASLKDLDYNLIIDTAHDIFPNGMGNQVVLSLQSPEQNNGWVFLGEQIAYSIQRKYKAYAEEKLQETYKEAMENEYVIDFFENVKEKLEVMVAQLNKDVFKHYYSVELEPNQIVRFLRDTLSMIHVEDFFIKKLIQGVSPVITSFVQNYLWYTSTLTLMPNLMINLGSQITPQSNFANTIVVGQNYNLLSPILSIHKMTYHQVHGFDIFAEERRLVI